MPEFFCIFILATLTGMRVGEYSALTKADIDFDTGEVYVTKQFTRGKLKNRTKTIGSTRIVHISLKVRGIIKWHIRKYEVFTGFLFKDSIGQPVSAKWVSRKFKNETFSAISVNTLPNKMPANKNNAKINPFLNPIFISSY